MTDFDSGLKVGYLLGAGGAVSAYLTVRALGVLLSRFLRTKK